MNQRIDLSEHDQMSRSFLVVLCALTILALGITIWIDRSPFETSHQESMTWMVTRGGILFPWIIAAGQTIENGLHAFSGRPPEIVPSSVRVAAIGGLCLSFVIFPTVFLFRWRERRLSAYAHDYARPLRVRDLVYGFCEITTVFFAVTIVQAVVVQKYSNASIRSAQAIQSNEDDMINEINKIAISARQYRILPTSLGGGNGRCNGYLLPENLETSAGAFYSAQVLGDTIIVQARSAKYPDARIKVVIPGATLGQASHRRWSWAFAGEFL